MAFDHTVKGQALGKRSGWQDFFVVMISDSTHTTRFLPIQLLTDSLPHRGVLLVSREVPVKHLSCRYVKHIGRSDRRVAPADSSVHTSDERWTHNEVHGVCFFCAEHGAEDITVLRDGLAFLSTVRADSQRSQLK